MIELSVLAWVYGQFSYSKSHYVRHLINTQVRKGEPWFLRTTKKIGLHGWGRGRKGVHEVIRRREGECLFPVWVAAFAAH